ncbi:MAG: lipocalin family protein [Anaeromyxobacteraceae bacterium]|nr:lipocalin family protein [Anaeromyxobacteraceae bacterium]
MPLRHAAPALSLAALLVGCASTAPMKTVDRVDLPRFMGDWYVLGAIPAEQERNAVNGVETYRLRPGTTDVVDTTYVFREGAFDGELVTLRPTGYVEGEGNGARWGMKFAWWQGPFRLEYLVAFLDPDYTRTVIARSARDYVWIMARTPSLPPDQWEELVRVVRDLGYDTARLRVVPQRWGVPPDLSPGERAPAPVRPSRPRLGRAPLVTSRRRAPTGPRRPRTRR